jgi:enamine deaminase RidA (YjgF/YER057c/UK114 family)
MSQIEDRIRQLGFNLPQAPAAVGAYIPVIRTGNLVVTSGQLPFVGKTLAFKGKVGAAISVEDGANAARIAALNCLAQIKSCVGSLEAVTRIVRVEGYVNSAPQFHDQPQVMNSASQFMADVFGEIGRHTRIAVGANELPLDAAVEVVVWAEVSANAS